MSEPFPAASEGPDSGSLGTASVDNASANYDSQQGGASGGSDVNPAWKEALGAIPREFSPVLTPHLRKFDQNYGSLAQSYSPWKKTFADKGITVEELQQAHLLYQTMNTNPQMVYERLGAALGISPQQAQQFVEQEQESGDEEQQQEGYDDPRYADMATRLQYMEGYLQQQVQAQQQQYERQQFEYQTSQYEQQLDQGIAILRQNDPNFDVEDVLNRVLLQQAQNEPLDLVKAYQDHVSFTQRVRATPLNGSNAPAVMPTGGGLPPTIDNSRPQTNAEKAARVEALIKAASGQG